jgi:hypothetical protein
MIATLSTSVWGASSRTCARAVLTLPRAAVSSPTVLPLFLSARSWAEFAGTDEVRLLRPGQLADLLTALAIKSVVFDPASDTATRMSAEDVLNLLNSGTPTGAPARQVGHTQFLPHRELAEQLASCFPASQVEAWALHRHDRAQSTPVLAVPSDLPAKTLQSLVDGLRRSSAKLPKTLELLQLDDDATSRARSAWSGAKIDWTQP